MGEIVDLASERGVRAGRDPAETPHGPAQIVLYTGVRYERHDDPPPAAPPAPTKSKRRKRKST